MADKTNDTRTEVAAPEPITAASLAKMVGKAAVNAPLLFDDAAYGHSRVASVALRVDQDGTATVILYRENTPGRRREACEAVLELAEGESTGVAEDILEDASSVPDA